MRQELCLRVFDVRARATFWIATDAKEQVFRRLTEREAAALDAGRALSRWRDARRAGTGGLVPGGGHTRSYASSRAKLQNNSRFASECESMWSEAGPHPRARRRLRAVVLDATELGTTRRLLAKSAADRFEAVHVPNPFVFEGICAAVSAESGSTVPSTVPVYVYCCLLSELLRLWPRVARLVEQSSSRSGGRVDEPLSRKIDCIFADYCCTWSGDAESAFSPHKDAEALTSKAKELLSPGAVVAVTVSCRNDSQFGTFAGVRRAVRHGMLRADGMELVQAYQYRECGGLARRDSDDGGADGESDAPENGGNMHFAMFRFGSVEAPSAPRGDSRAPYQSASSPQRSRRDEKIIEARQHRLARLLEWEPSRRDAGPPRRRAPAVAQAASSRPQDKPLPLHVDRIRGTAGFEVADQPLSCRLGTLTVLSRTQGGLWLLFTDAVVESLKRLGGLDDGQLHVFRQSLRPYGVAVERNSAWRLWRACGGARVTSACRAYPLAEATRLLPKLLSPLPVRDADHDVEMHAVDVRDEPRPTTTALGASTGRGEDKNRQDDGKTKVASMTTNGGVRIDVVEESMPPFLFVVAVNGHLYAPLQGLDLTFCCKRGVPAACGASVRVGCGAKELARRINVARGLTMTRQAVAPLALYRVDLVRPFLTPARLPRAEPEPFDGDHGAEDRRTTRALVKKRARADSKARPAKRARLDKKEPGPKESSQGRYVPYRIVKQLGKSEFSVSWQWLGQPRTAPGAVVPDPVPRIDDKRWAELLAEWGESRRSAGSSSAVPQS